MIVFPVMKSLVIEGYGMYPPSLERPFLITFEPGPNAIIGVNGSGKTTFISIALRCLTGPYNLPSATSESELGQVRPRVVPMSRHNRHSFGDDDKKVHTKDVRTFLEKEFPKDSLPIVEEVRALAAAHRAAMELFSKNEARASREAREKERRAELQRKQQPRRQAVEQEAKV